MYVSGLILKSEMLSGKNELNPLTPPKKISFSGLL